MTDVHDLISASQLSNFDGHFFCQVPRGHAGNLEAPREGEGRLEEVDDRREEGPLQSLLLPDHR